MKISRKQVAPLALGVAALFWSAGILSSMRFGYISPDLVLRSTLREVVRAAKEGKDASSIKELADAGMERAERIRRQESKDFLPLLLFVSGVGIVTSALIFESIKNRANQSATANALDLT